MHMESVFCPQSAIFFRSLPPSGAVLQLIVHEKPAIWQARARAARVDDTMDARFERPADLVEQVGDGGVVRRLLDPQLVVDGQITQLGFERASRLILSERR